LGRNLAAAGARITALEPRRFEGDDALLADNHWKASTSGFMRLK
jgi:hypothetical protein